MRAAFRLFVILLSPLVVFCLFGQAGCPFIDLMLGAANSSGGTGGGGGQGGGGGVAGGGGGQGIAGGGGGGGVAPQPITRR